MTTAAPQGYTLTSPQLELLKWAAVITMTADHAGFFLFQETALFMPLRIVGRAAFPLFAFLAAYHLYHYPSSARMAKYARRLFVFALVAQPFHTLAFGISGGIRLNIVFQFAVFAAAVCCWRLFRENGDNAGALHWAGVFLLATAGLTVSAVSEYGLGGLLLCMACYAYFYFARQGQKLWGCIVVLAAAVAVNAGMAASGGDTAAGMAAALVLTVLLVSAAPLFGNGLALKRMPRYFFYVYYPLHLLLLAAAAGRLSFN